MKRISGSLAALCTWLSMVSLSLSVSSSAWAEPDVPDSSLDVEYSGGSLDAGVSGTVAFEYEEGPPLAGD